MAQTNQCGHLDRLNYSKNMCRQCYMAWWLLQGGREVLYDAQRRYRRSTKGRRTVKKYLERPDVQTRMKEYNQTESGQERFSRYNDSFKGKLRGQLYNRRRQIMRSIKPSVIRFAFRYEFRNQDEFPELIGYPAKLYAVPFVGSNQQKIGKFAAIDERGVFVAELELISIRRLKNGESRREWENASLFLLPYPELSNGPDVLQSNTLYKYRDMGNQIHDYPHDSRVRVLVASDADGMTCARGILVDPEGKPIKVLRDGTVLSYPKAPTKIVYLSYDQLEAVDTGPEWKEKAIAVTEQMPELMRRNAQD